jgi:hypothetical protein
MKKRAQKPKTFAEHYMSVRRTWGTVKPVTQVKESDKLYSRSQSKNELRSRLSDEI